MSTDEIATFLARVALKDRAAFSALYNIASPKLFAICLRMLKDRSEAEDALQEVFVRVWHRADSFSAAGNSGAAWIAAVARHHCIDRIRVRQPIGAELDEAEQLPALDLDPEQNALMASEGKRIDSCMEELESDRAQAVRFAYVEGASYQELADRFGVPLNTMRTWLRRSLLKLRECLDR